MCDAEQLQRASATMITKQKENMNVLVFGNSTFRCIKGYFIDITMAKLVAQN